MNRKKREGKIQSRGLSCVRFGIVYSMIIASLTVCVCVCVLFVMLTLGRLPCTLRDLALLRKEGHGFCLLELLLAVYW